jgi:hypothetical protein
MSSDSARLGTPNLELRGANEAGGGGEQDLSSAAAQPRAQSRRVACRSSSAPSGSQVSFLGTTSAFLRYPRIVLTSLNHSRTRLIPAKRPLPPSTQRRRSRLLPIAALLSHPLHLHQISSQSSSRWL